MRLINCILATAIVLLQTCDPPDTPIPVIDKISPEKAAPGSEIVIEGDFLDYVNYLFIDTVKLTPFIVNQDSIRANIPEDFPIGTYKLFVTSFEGKSNQLMLTIIPERPIIDRIEPTTARMNDTLKIWGKFFDGTDLKVKIADLVFTEFILANDSLISLLVTNGFKPGNLTVVNGNGTSDTVYFNFSDGSSPVPFINDYEPKQGAVGSNIIVTGYNFAERPLTIIFPPDITLTEPTGYNVESDTKLRITVPVGGITGKISIGNMYGTRNIDFEVLSPPVIRAIRPKSNKIGGPMLIYGKNFKHVKKVMFGNTIALSGSKINYFQRGENEEIIALYVPDDIAPGEYQVKAYFENDPIGSNDTSFTVLSGSMKMPKYLPSIVVPNPPPVNILSNLNNNWLVMDNQEKRIFMDVEEELDPEHPPIIFGDNPNAGIVNIEDNSIILNDYYGKLDLAYTAENDTVLRLILTPLEKGNQVEMIFPIYIESLEPSTAHPGDSVIVHGRYFLENDSREIKIDDNDAISIGFRRISEDKILIGIPENILPGEHTVRIYYDVSNPSNALRLTINSK